MSDDNNSKVANFSSGDILVKYDRDGKIASFLDQIFLYNRKINIVSRETSRKELNRLAADCLVPFEFEVNISGQIFDIGTGGGFPSVPLILANRSLKAVLIERTGKKARFLSEINEKFNLGAQIINQNFVEAAGQLKTGRFDFGLMKYVKLDRKIYDSAISLLKPGGRFIYYSRVDLSEIIAGENISVGQHCYYLDDTSRVRTLTIFSKKV